MQSVEIVVGDRQVALAFDQRRPRTGLRFEPGTDTEGEGVGVRREAVLSNALITQSRFADRLQRDVLGLRRPGWRERQKQDEGAVHI